MMASHQRTLLGHPFRILSAACATALWAKIISAHTYTFVPTNGASMMPTLPMMGGWVLQSRWYRRGRGIQVGDVVAFRSVRVPGETVIKRIVGVEGDFVMRDTPESGSDSMLMVPPGHFWAVGDNMSDSVDSRHFGPVPMGLIVGKVVAQILPWRERKWFESPLSRHIE